MKWTLGEKLGFLAPKELESIKPAIPVNGDVYKERCHCGRGMIQWEYRNGWYSWFTVWDSSFDWPGQPGFVPCCKSCKDDETKEFENEMALIGDEY